MATRIKAAIIATDLAKEEDEIGGIQATSLCIRGPLKRKWVKFNVVKSLSVGNPAVNAGSGQP